MIVSPPKTTRVWAFTPKLYKVSMINSLKTKHVPRTEKRWERIWENFFEPNFEVLTSFLGSAQPPTSCSSNEPSSVEEMEMAMPEKSLCSFAKEARQLCLNDQTYQVSILLVQSVERNHIWFCEHRNSAAMKSDDLQKRFCNDHLDIAAN